jgi:hypothetical protein
MSKSPTVEKVAERFVGKVIPLLLEWFYEPEQRAMLFNELFRNPELDSMLSAGGAKPDDLKKAVTECLYAIASAVKGKNPEPKG